MGIKKEPRYSMHHRMRGKLRGRIRKERRDSLYNRRGCKIPGKKKK
jgi:hypothetical protein